MSYTVGGVGELFFSKEQRLRRKEDNVEREEMEDKGERGQGGGTDKF